MVDFPTKDAFFPTGQANAGPVRAGQRQMYDAMRQMPGAQAVSTLTIAAGAVTPTRYIHAIDTEGAAASDDLANILQTNLPDGALLLIKSVDGARQPTVKDSAGGTGQILLADGADLMLADPTMRLLLRRDGAAWVEEDRFYGNQVAAARAFLGLAAIGTADGELLTNAILKGTARTFTKPQRVAPATNAAATGSVTVDLSAANSHELTLTGDVTLLDASNLAAGQEGCLDLAQDGTGGRTVVWAAKWNFLAGSTEAPDSAAGDRTVYAYKVRADGATLDVARAGG